MTQHIQKPGEDIHHCFGIKQQLNNQQVISRTCLCSVLGRVRQKKK